MQATQTHIASFPDLLHVGISLGMRLNMHNAIVEI